MGPTAVLTLWRRRHDERPDARDECRYHVHDDAGRVDRLPARDVEAHAVDRDPPLRHGSPFRGLRNDLGPSLPLMHQPGAADALAQGVDDGRVEAIDRGGDH